MLTNMAFSLLTCISDDVNLSTIGCWGVNRLLGELLLVCLVYLILVRSHVDQVLVTWAGQRCSAVILIRISRFRVKCKCILYTRMYFHTCVLYARVYFTHVCTLHTYVLYTYVLYTRMYFTHVCTLHKYVLYTRMYFTHVCTLHTYILYTLMYFTHVCTLHTYVLYTRMYFTHVCTLHTYTEPRRRA